MFGFSSPFRAPKPANRRRNPHFAPEFLERRLHPSGFARMQVPVEVAEATPENPEPAPNPDGTPPYEPLPVPHGPVLPA